MSGPFKRRPSLKTLPAFGASPQGLRRRSSTLPGVAALLGQNENKQTQEREVPWDLLDRCLLPIIFCHAAAMILSTVLNMLHISNVTTLTLFIWLTISTVAAVLFYHNLKVTAAGKAVLITGCDQPLGYTLARKLDELGFTVFAGCQHAGSSDENEESGRYASSLREISSGRLHVLQLDVGNETQILSGSLYVVEHLPAGAPGLWAVVHCAGSMPVGEIEWIPHKVIKQATEITLLGATRLTQVMLPLIRRARGRLVYLSSGLARAPTAARGIHCALLAALETQAACLRRELRPRAVDVVVVAPGEYTVGTSWMKQEGVREQAREMWEQMGDERRDEYGEGYFEAAVRSVEKYTKSYDVDTSMVLRSLLDSVVRTFPLPKYTPVSRKEKLQAFIADYFPRSVYDILYA